MVVGHLGLPLLPAEEDHLPPYPAGEVHQALVQVLEEDPEGGEVAGVGLEGAQEAADLPLQGPGPRGGGPGPP